MESWETRWRKAKGKRGVSPIIATILLVAITVVLAAVLYILVSGYIGGTGSKPLTFSPSGSTPSTATSSTGTSYYDTLAVSASTGLTTAEFGLKIAGVSGNVIAPLASASIQASCSGTFVEAGVGSTAAGDCPAVAPGTGGTPAWYAVLVNSSGGVVATYGSSGWSSTQVVSNSDTLVLVNYGSQLAGSGDTLSAFGIGGSSVSGSTTL